MKACYGGKILIYSLTQRISLKLVSSLHVPTPVQAKPSQTTLNLQKPPTHPTHPSILKHLSTPPHHHHHTKTLISGPPPHSTSPHPPNHPQQARPPPPLLQTPPILAPAPLPRLPIIHLPEQKVPAAVLGLERLLAAQAGFAVEAGVARAGGGVGAYEFGVFVGV